MATTAYDVVEYPGGVFAQTHPARLAAIARLHGVPAAAPGRCRLLELGTSDGGNLLPLAVAYPASEFVGCDLAETAVAKGLADRDALGLKNLTLLAGDLRDLPDSLGPFDYVIAHGVFSWVPDAVRDGLLGLCRRLLAPHGVAYVSYNALPGGHIAQMVADMMRYHTRRMPDPQEKISQARRLMKLVADGTPVPGPLGDVLRQEAGNIVDQYGDAVVYHDDLATMNRRYFFHEVAELADRHGLQFLAEADYHEMSNFAFPPAVAAVLDELGKVDRIEEEQYRDFLRLRRFRQTLFVRQGVEVVTPARVSAVAELHVSANPMTPESPDPDLSPGVAVRFETEKGSRVTVDHPLPKAALLELSRAPHRPKPVAAVIETAAGRLGQSAVPEAGRNAVLSMLLQSYQVGLVRLTLDPPAFATRPGPTPELWPLARYELETGGATVTTLRHVTAHIDTPLTRELVLACDGRRDHTAILDRVADWATTLPPGDGPVRTREELRSALAVQLEAGLQKAADLALFVA
jgi:SAM-dependent methyltransferase